jgi:hypothetical protein
MKNLMVTLLLSVVAGCSSSPEPYSSQIKQLADDSSSHKGQIEEFNANVKKFLGDGRSEDFQTEEEADQALTYLKQYPLDPDSSFKATDLIREGIPESADQRVIIKARADLHPVPVSPYIQLCNRLTASARKFSWSKPKTQTFTSLVVDRAYKNTEKPGSLLQVALDISMLRKLLKDQLLKDSNNSAAKLEDLQRNQKAKSREITAWYTSKSYISNLIWAKPWVIDWVPQFYFKTWNDQFVNELRLASDFEKQLHGVIDKLRAGNKI